MYNYPVNHGDIRIIKVGVANVVPRIVRVLAYVHSLSLIPRESLPGSEWEDVSISAGGSED